MGIRSKGLDSGHETWSPKPSSESKSLPSWSRRRNDGDQGVALKSPMTTVRFDRAPLHRVVAFSARSRLVGAGVVGASVPKATSDNRRRADLDGHLDRGLAERGIGRVADPVERRVAQHHRADEVGVRGVEGPHHVDLESGCGVRQPGDVGLDRVQDHEHVGAHGLEVPAEPVHVDGVPPGVQRRPTAAARRRGPGITGQHAADHHRVDHEHECRDRRGDRCAERERAECQHESDDGQLDREVRHQLERPPRSTRKSTGERDRQHDDGREQDRDSEQGARADASTVPVRLLRPELGGGVRSGLSGCRVRGRGSGRGGSRACAMTFALVRIRRSGARAIAAVSSATRAVPACRLVPPRSRPAGGAPRPRRLNHRSSRARERPRHRRGRAAVSTRCRRR